MYTKDVVVGARLNIYSQPEAVFIQKANAYKSSIWVEKGDRKANAKSLLGVLSLGLTSGQSIKISAEGDDEELAVASLEELITE